MIRVLFAIVCALLLSQFAAAKPLFGLPKPMTAKEFKIAYAELCLRADALDSLAMHGAAADTLMRRADDVYSRLSELLQDRRSAKADLSKLMERSVLGGVKSTDGRLYGFSVDGFQGGTDHPYFSLLYYVPVKGRPIISAMGEGRIFQVVVVDAVAKAYLTVDDYHSCMSCYSLTVNLVQVRNMGIEQETVFVGDSPEELNPVAIFDPQARELVCTYTDGFQEEKGVPGETEVKMQRESHKICYRWDGKAMVEVEHARFAIPKE